MGAVFLCASHFIFISNTKMEFKSFQYVREVYYKSITQIPDVCLLCQLDEVENVLKNMKER